MSSVAERDAVAAYTETITVAERLYELLIGGAHRRIVYLATGRRDGTDIIRRVRQLCIDAEPGALADGAASLRRRVIRANDDNIEISLDVASPAESVRLHTVPCAAAGDACRGMTFDAVVLRSSLVDVLDAHRNEAGRLLLPLLSSHQAGAPPVAVYTETIEVDVAWLRKALQTHPPAPPAADGVLL
jgi:hypothetical protein